MLGANVGTSLIVQVLSFNVSAAAPVLLVVGVVAFKPRRAHADARSGPGRDRPRADAAGAPHPARHAGAGGGRAGGAQLCSGSRRREPVLNVLLGALLAWAAHSSVAVVILVMSSRYSHFVTPVAALALVLGANLGSAINPVLEGGSSDNPARLPAAGRQPRSIASSAAPSRCPSCPDRRTARSALDPNPARQAADFHTVFNLDRGRIFILPLERYRPAAGRGCCRSAQGGRSRARRSISTRPPSTSPSVALTCAAREVLHMGDIVETMLRRDHDRARHRRPQARRRDRAHGRRRRPAARGDQALRDRHHAREPRRRRTAAGPWRSSPFPSISSISATSSTRT